MPRSAADRAGSAAGGHHPRMAESLAIRPIEAGIDLLPPPNPTISPAKDLGGVTVLKHGNLYLLSDALGDIRPDARGLGLYDLDTRILSCAALLVNGVSPTLLRGHTASNHTSVIQLLNPETRRDPAIKQDAADALALRSLSITRPAMPAPCASAIDTRAGAAGSPDVDSIIAELANPFALTTSGAHTEPTPLSVATPRASVVPVQVNADRSSIAAPATGLPPSLSVTLTSTEPAL